MDMHMRKLLDLETTLNSTKTAIEKIPNDITRGERVVCTSFLNTCLEYVLNPL